MLNPGTLQILGRTVLVLVSAAIWPAVAFAAQRAPDFNGDGFADMPIGIPLENIGSIADAGAVEVIYGADNGLRASRDQFWSQSSGGIADQAEAGDRFGSAMAWGDFDGDGFDDLAIGVPLEDSGNVMNGGAVHIIYGSALGLDAAGSQVWTQNSLGVIDISENSDLFGFSLATGDFDGDGFIDLAIGARGETVEGMTNAGAVNVLYGSASGLAAAGNQFWTQESSGVADQSEMGDRFGLALAGGDFDNDGVDDLAIGVPGEGLGITLNAGTVNVLYGADGQGLTSFGDQLFTEDTFGVPMTALRDDVFGDALTVGDFDGDDLDDLAIGAPGKDIDGPFQDEGAVFILYGRSTNGLGGTGSQVFHQETIHVPGIPRQGDHFGAALASGDFDRDGLDDLAVGCPNDDFESLLTVGTVTILYGRNTGLSATDSVIWSQHSDHIAETAQTGDEFGSALLAGDFDDDGRDDLAIGVPGESVSGVLDAGAVNVLYGSDDGLSAPGDQIWTQDVTNIDDIAENTDRVGQSLGAGEIFLPI